MPFLTTLIYLAGGPVNVVFLNIVLNVTYHHHHDNTQEPAEPVELNDDEASPVTVPQTPVVPATGTPKYLIIIGSHLKTEIPSRTGESVDDTVQDQTEGLATEDVAQGDLEIEDGGTQIANGNLFIFLSMRF